jgi:hypothetical protein
MVSIRAASYLGWGPRADLGSDIGASIDLGTYQWPYQSSSEIRLEQQ